LPHTNRIGVGDRTSGNIRDLLSRIGTSARRTSVVDLEKAIPQELATLSESPFDTEFQPQEVPFLQQLNEAISRVEARETATTPEQREALAGLFKAADPTERLDAAKKFISQIVGPSNLAQSIAGGFGPQAAVEATAQAGAGIALPIVTEASRQQGAANQFKALLEEARIQRNIGKDQDIFSAVLSKVNQGQQTAGLNLDRARLGANENLQRASLRLQSLRDLAGIRTNQATINASLARRAGGGGTSGIPSLFPGGVRGRTGSAFPVNGGGVALGGTPTSRLVEQTAFRERVGGPAPLAGTGTGGAGVLRAGGFTGPLRSGTILRSPGGSISVS